MSKIVVVNFIQGLNQKFGKRGLINYILTWKRGGGRGSAPLGTESPLIIKVFFFQRGGDQAKTWVVTSPFP